MVLVPALFLSGAAETSGLSCNGGIFETDASLELYTSKVTLLKSVSTVFELGS
jgi:hypothetical protein